MSIALVVNGITYDYPEVDDTDWGAEATDWAAAVTSGMLQKAGGLFQLLAEADFGSSYGIKSLYYKTRTANVASAGQVRLALTDVISWRNAANDGNLDLALDGSGNLLFNGTPIVGTFTVDDTTTIDLSLTGSVLTGDIVAASITNAMVSASAAIAYSKLNLSGGIVNADVNAAAAIVYSKLSLTGGIVNADVNASAGIVLTKLAATTASRALVSDGSGFIIPATTTATEIGYVNGVTSAIQTQINTKMTNPMTTGGDVIYGGASGVPTRLANGSAGQVLTSAGTTSAPTWTSLVAGYNLGSSQIFTADDTWTKPAGCLAVMVEVQAGGGAGSGCPSTSGGETVPGTGGGGGGYARKFITAGLGGTEAVAVGLGGTGNSGGAGNAGGSSSFGAHCSATGGGGGGTTTSSSGARIGLGGAGGNGLGGTGTGGNVNIAGQSASDASSSATAGVVGTSSAGGNSVLGRGGYGRSAVGSSAALIGGVGVSYGGGGGGNISGASQSASTGPAGAPGIVIVYEYY